MKRTLIALAAAVGIVVPAVVWAPKPDRDDPASPATIDDAIASVRECGLVGWEQVDFATRLVHARFRHFSLWHLWETPRVAYRHRRGYSNQYNLALAEVLRGAGFRVQIVHAARVRSVQNPWWSVGHTWLRVTVDGSTHDVCAGDASNTPGQLAFVPQTEVRPQNPWSPTLMAVALAPFSLATIWRYWLRRRPVPRWLYRPFGTPVRDEG